MTSQVDSERSRRHLQPIPTSGLMWITTRGAWVRWVPRKGLETGFIEAGGGLRPKGGAMMM